MHFLGQPGKQVSNILSTMENKIENNSRKYISEKIENNLLRLKF